MKFFSEVYFEWISERPSQLAAALAVESGEAVLRLHRGAVARTAAVVLAAVESALEART